mmetsp:Transcript_57323/g.153516  ORF Transcript_57323/g.153516 Transcript_57323/m.153516 type:complete len:206 (+) Transcript_57323:415-1032(+)
MAGLHSTEERPGCLEREPGLGHLAGLGRDGGLRRGLGERLESVLADLLRGDRVRHDLHYGLGDSGVPCRHWLGCMHLPPLLYAVHFPVGVWSMAARHIDPSLELLCGAGLPHRPRLCAPRPRVRAPAGRLGGRGPQRPHRRSPVGLRQQRALDRGLGYSWSLGQSSSGAGGIRRVCRGHARGERRARAADREKGRGHHGDGPRRQ